jgi:hypothetical protein
MEVSLTQKDGGKSGQNDNSFDRFTNASHDRCAIMHLVVGKTRQLFAKNKASAALTYFENSP